MKVLGIKQFHQKTYKFLDISPRFKGLLGKAPENFILVLYGYSGNGKTECALQLATELSPIQKAAWWAYEQGHGADLQMATMRNEMEQYNGSFYVIDPHDIKDSEINEIEDLLPNNLSEEKRKMKIYFYQFYNYVAKRGSPKVHIVDSLDYTEWGWHEYDELKKLADKKKKIIIFLAHSFENGKVVKAISRRVIFDGGMGFWVKDYICFPKKNRFGGKKPHVIWEEEARERNPVFFAKKKKETPQPAADPLEKESKKPPHKRKKKETEKSETSDQ